VNAWTPLPGFLKPPLRPVRRGSRIAAGTFWTAVSGMAYRNPDGRWLRLLGRRIRRRFRLDAPPRGSRKIEMGPGWRPRPGYIHVDLDAASPDLDLLGSGHRLPSPDGWADEVLAVHMIEHVPPARLKDMLSEWHRVLGNGGVLELHTPDGRGIARALLHAASANKEAFWALQSALFGYGWAPAEVHRPEQFRQRGDHRTLFVFPVLAALLRQAGFSNIRDVSGVEPCHHMVDWASYVPGLSLEVLAQKDRLQSASSRKKR
jgi:SAM-dependent methyltransferase